MLIIAESFYFKIVIILTNSKKKIKIIKKTINKNFFNYIFIKYHIISLEFVFISCFDIYSYFNTKIKF